MKLGNNNNNISELDKAKQFLNDTDVPSINIQEELGLNKFVENTIKTNLASTITIKYNLSIVYVIVTYPSDTRVVKFEGYSPDLYWDFCKELLCIDREEQYNCSRTLNIENIRTRVYSVQPPLVRTPVITISTTKIPPATLPKQTISDEAWNEILHSNFIICGGSGAGKTYLFNYLLSRFIKDDEKIGLIEEFGELIPPNDLTITITTPPVKPGETPLLRFITEQSNLMRLDAVYIGEIKGREAWPFVTNLVSGTRGGCTIHGETAAAAMNRLRSLCELECSNTEAVNEFLAKAIKYIIVMRKKNIFAIYKMTGTHNKNTFAMEEIYS